MHKKPNVVRKHGTMLDWGEVDLRDYQSPLDLPRQQALASRTPEEVRALARQLAPKVYSEKELRK